MSENISPLLVLVTISKLLGRKIINIFFFINLPICFGCSNVFGAKKNRLIETVLLSTHNICFRCSKEPTRRDNKIFCVRNRENHFFITHFYLEAC